MRVLYVLRYWPTATETFVADEIRGLRAAGVDIELAAFDPREDVGGEAPAIVHAQPHRWAWLGVLPMLIREWLRGPGRVPVRVLWLAAVLRRGRFTRVHVHFAGEAAAWTAAACARTGVPWSVTVHAVDLFKPRPDLGLLLHTAARVVTVTEHNRAWIMEKYGIVATVVRCGVVVPGPVTRRVEEPPLVLSVGRWVPKKGLDVLVAAVARLDRAARVVIYSDAPPLEGIEVAGLRPHDEVLAALREAAVFVLPCRRAPDGDMDGLPVAIIEALAAGVPVITTPVSGIPELVDAEVGWLVPPDDVEALVVALRAALDDPGEAARRGALGRDRVRERGFERARSVSAMREVLGVDGQRGRTHPSSG